MGNCPFRYTASSVSYTHLQLTVYKEGQVLTGANVTENGTTFKYEKRRQKGAIYDV